MPILNNEDGKTKVIFGYGDIKIGSGMFTSKEGLVTFEDQEPKPIGYFVKNEEKEIDADNYKLHFEFKNIESLDVLIERLERTRKYMTGELDVYND